MIDLLYLPPGNQWDQNLLRRLFAGELHRHGLETQEHADYPDSDGLVVVIPGQYWHERTDELTQAFSRYRYILAIKTGDEENLLDIRKVQHPNIKWWVQTPRTDRGYGNARLFGVGYPPHFNDMPATDVDKDLDVFLSAQKTHGRRREAFNVLEGLPYSSLVQATDGFTKGMEPTVYRGAMLRAKVAPAPSGAVSPDSFRFYEALEAHTVPIADDVSPVYNSRGYWRSLFPDAPFPILEDYADLPGYIEDQLTVWPANANWIAAWWMRQKRSMTEWLREDLGALGIDLSVDDSLAGRLTVVIPTSPIPSNPDTKILDETIKSIRHHLPGCEIVLTFDGVRIEQEDRREAYDEYIRCVLWKADHVWGNVVPIMFDTHTHQVGMARVALDYIRTPLLLYVEADTPLTSDCEIDWQTVTDAVLSGEVNHLRFSHEALILDAHKQLMLDTEPVDINGCPVVRTVQYSQRPHVASVAFYRRVLDGYFSDNAKCFIEDVLHGAVQRDYQRDGMQGWNQWRLGIYHPEGNIKRSYHIDGRQGEAKYDEKQVF